MRSMVSHSSTRDNCSLPCCSPVSPTFPPQSFSSSTGLPFQHWVKLKLLCSRNPPYPPLSYTWEPRRCLCLCIQVCAAMWESDDWGEGVATGRQKWVKKAEKKHCDVTVLHDITPGSGSASLLSSFQQQQQRSIKFSSLGSNPATALKSARTSSCVKTVKSWIARHDL